MCSTTLWCRRNVSQLQDVILFVIHSGRYHIATSDSTRRDFDIEDDIELRISVWWLSAEREPVGEIFLNDHLRMDTKILVKANHTAQFIEDFQEDALEWTRINALRDENQQQMRAAIHREQQQRNYSEVICTNLPYIFFFIFVIAFAVIGARSMWNK